MVGNLLNEVVAVVAVFVYLVVVVVVVVVVAVVVAKQRFGLREVGGRCSKDPGTMG